MPLTFAADKQPKVMPGDVSSLPFKGIRASGVASTTTVTVTVAAATVAKEWGLDTRANGSVILALTDLIAYSDAAGALLQVQSGGTMIWETYLGAGTFQHTFETPLMADRGADLEIVVSGATSKCSASMSGLGLYIHSA